MERRTFLQTSVAVAAVSGLAGLGALPTLAMPFEKKRKSVLGHDIAYIDEGAGRPVVFLHGNPTSSYLWRNIIPYVTDTHRAIAPDLMGMGDSDKPAMIDTYKESAEYLFAFLDGLDLEDAILVIHDWGSCLGWHYARTLSRTDLRHLLYGGDGAAIHAHCQHGAAWALHRIPSGHSYAWRW